MENNILLIEIPKSASTSLMYSIANNFNLDCGQYFPNKNKILYYGTILSKYLSDIGDFIPKLIAKISMNNYVSKEFIRSKYNSRNRSKIYLS